MSLQVTKQPLKLPPALNALAVMVQGQQDVLKEMQKTKEVFAEYVNESQETISSQAEENQKLKAELASLKQMHAREIAALKSTHAAEKVKMGSGHAIDIAKYVAAAKVDQSRITGLANRIDQEVALVQKHRAVLASLLDHFYLGDRPKQARKDAYDRARQILN